MGIPDEDSLDPVSQSLGLGGIGMALHLNDILNSTFNKPREEVSSKNINNIIAPAKVPPAQPVTIKIDRTVISPTGNKTTFSISLNHTFSTAKELRDVLAAVDFPDNTSWLRTVKIWLIGGK